MLGILLYFAITLLFVLGIVACGILGLVSVYRKSPPKRFEVVALIVMLLVVAAMPLVIAHQRAERKPTPGLDRYGNRVK